MGLLATFHLSSPQLPLVRTAAAAGTELTVETILTTDPDGPVVVCWVEAAAFERFEASLDGDEVRTFSVLETTPDRRLYHVRLERPPLFPLKEAFDSFGATPLVGSVIRGDGWLARARVPDRDALVAFRRACQDRGVSFRLEGLSESDRGERDGASLTPKQREALLLAYDSGYYDVPRRSSLGDLGERLEISKPSVASRLRRAEQRVIGAVLDRRGL